MNAHTPGPWVVEGMGSDTLMWIVAGNGKRLATLPDHDGHGIDVVESRCNARLISAAPDLLAACEELLRFVIDHCDEGFLAEASEYAEIETARAAIAKARGEQE